MASQNLKSTHILRLIPLLLIASLSDVATTEGVGVNWGTEASHPLPPQKVVELLKANNIAKVKLFDADPLVLQALAGTKIHVTVGIPNSMLRSLNSSLKAAESWVHDNLTRFVSDGASRVLIDYVAVGDEPFLQTYGDQFSPFVVGAAANIQAALVKSNLAEKVKVVVPCSFDAFQIESGPKSKAHFRPNINRTMIQLLTFLTRHHSPFLVTISPFQIYHENKNLSLHSALFRKTPHKKNETHKNIFDTSYNTVVSALSDARFAHLDIVVSKIGWPTDGAPNTTSSLAQEFTKGLTEHLHSKSVKSLPSEIYIFTLLDEDERSTANGNYERHWGVFTFDGQAKYQADLGQGSRNLVNAQDVGYLSPKWCVVNNNKDLSNATALVSEACAAADCTAMFQGGSCFNLSWPGNVSYAFNSYYQEHDQRAESCDFAGLGLITTVDPSVGSCRFVVGLRTSVSVSLSKSVPFCWMMTVLLWLVSEMFW